jgi:hypothetical protein
MLGTGTPLVTVKMPGQAHGYAEKLFQDRLAQSRQTPAL